MSEGSHFSQVVELLRAEAEAIGKTAARLRQDQVDRVIEMLANCSGKVVVLGVGKSGIIAQKIAATMTSAGTAAVYLHPSDALHGGLGIVTSNDVVIVLSNSGETDELRELLPYLKRREVPMIAIVVMTVPPAPPLLVRRASAPQIRRPFCESCAQQRRLERGGYLRTA